MSILNIPLEIFLCIIECEGIEKEDLKELRLVHPIINTWVVPKLFDRIVFQLRSTVHGTNEIKELATRLLDNIEDLRGSYITRFPWRFYLVIDKKEHPWSYGKIKNATAFAIAFEANFGKFLEIFSGIRYIILDVCLDNITVFEGNKIINTVASNLGDRQIHVDIRGIKPSRVPVIDKLPGLNSLTISCDSTAQVKSIRAATTRLLCRSPRLLILELDNFGERLNDIFEDVGEEVLANVEILNLITGGKLSVETLQKFKSLKSLGWDTGPKFKRIQNEINASEIWDNLASTPSHNLKSLKVEGASLRRNKFLHFLSSQNASSLTELEVTVDSFWLYTYEMIDTNIRPEFLWTSFHNLCLPNISRTLRRLEFVWLPKPVTGYHVASIHDASLINKICAMRDGLELLNLGRMGILYDLPCLETVSTSLIYRENGMEICYLMHAFSGAPRLRQLNIMAADATIVTPTEGLLDIGSSIFDSIEKYHETNTIRWRTGMSITLEVILLQSSIMRRNERYVLRDGGFQNYDKIS